MIALFTKSWEDGRGRGAATMERASRSGGLAVLADAGMDSLRADRGLGKAAAGEGWGYI
jgi:hypothetical protein